MLFWSFLSRHFAPLFLGVICLLWAGCRKSDQNAAVTASNAPGAAARAGTELENAFKTGDPKVKALADEVVAAIRNNDQQKAFVELNALSSAPALTPQQKEATMQSLVIFNVQLRDAAAKGDAEAAKLLEKYRATK